MNEVYFQTLLERKYNAYHLAFPGGVTDLTNDTMNAEIKNWDSWKNAVGQILWYQEFHPRKQAKLIMFGAKPSHVHLQKMISIHKKLQVSLSHVYPSGDEEDIFNVETENAIIEHTTQ